MGQFVRTKATIFATIDAFQFCAIIPAIVIPIVLMMARRVQIGQVSAAAY
jgi:hypothetical protein